MVSVEQNKEADVTIRYVECFDNDDGQDSPTEPCHTDPSKTSTRRDETSWLAWLFIFLISAANCACSTMWLTASSVPGPSVQWLGASLTQVNWLSNAAAIVTAILSVPSAWAYERFGIKWTVLFSSIINAIGCWIRCIAIALPKERRYAVMLIGQMVGSIGGPFIYNCAAKVVAVWFAPQHRGIANTCLSIQLGMALGPLMIPRIAPTEESIPRLLFIVAGISTAVILPILVMPAKPHIQPSATAGIERIEFWKGLRILSKNKNFWCVAWLASLAIGMVYSNAVLIIEAITAYGYTESESGICAAVVVISGFFGGIMTGYWMGKTAQHLMLFKLLTPLTIFTYVAFIFQIVPNAFGSILITCALNGFIAYSLFPVYIEFCSEVSYPVPESVGSCIIWAGGAAMMLVLSVVLDLLRAGPDANPPYNMQYSLLAVAVIMAVGSIPTIWLEGKLNRLAVDREKGTLPA